MPQETTSSADYYDDGSRHGEYQYVKMQDIVNNYIMARDSDDYTSGTPRTKIIYQTRRAFREFYYDILREVRAVSLELSPSLQVTLPPDYVNYVRISWIDQNGELRPMAVDNRMNISQEYLQDSDYELLFDDEGCVLIEDSVDTNPNQPDISADIGTGVLGSYHKYSFCSGGFRPNLDTSRVFNNGKYRIDNNLGIIQFGSGVEGKEIVVEYISDGLYTGCEGRPAEELRIHKFAETAVLDYVYYNLIKQRRNVPFNEKQRARKEYFNSRRRAKLRINTLRKDEILQSFRASSKWIK